MRRARALGAASLLGLVLTVGCTPAVPEATEEPTAPAPTPEATETLAPEPDPPQTEGDEPLLGAAAVNAGHPAAVEAGMTVLEAGGTAVDAAVAVALAVSVVEPFASGIGGGGSAVVVPPGGEPVAYDFREVVPRSGIVPAGDAGVPGLVAGLGLLHEEAGVLPWADLVAPAVTLAEGSTVSGMLADQLRTPSGERAGVSLEHFFPGGQPLAAGDRLVQEDLAATLRTLADEGPRSLTDGSLARSLSSQAPALDPSSLESYRVQVSEPPRGLFAGHEVVTASPALPGVAMIQMLQIAEALGIGDAEPGSADYVQRMAAAWNHAVGSVETVLGDPDFVDVPVDELVDAERNARIAAEVGAGVARTSVDLKDSETTHLTIVDADGWVVSMTNTLTYFWGSGQYVDGYFLNNQLVRFSVGAGGRNHPEAGRRSVSWAVPTVVLDADGRPVLALGSPGGQRIPMITGDVLARTLLHGQSVEEAVAAPRFHAAGPELELEELPGGGVGDELRRRGFVVTGPFTREQYAFGSVQALAVDWESGEVVGAVDRRREAALTIGD